MNDNGIYCSPENVALQNSSSHVQSFNSSCREFRSSDGHETLYAPYGVPSWMIKEMVPLYEKPNTRFLQPQCKLNQKNQMHRQSPVFMQHENAEDSTLNHSTLYKENAIWSDSSFGESQTKMEPVLSKKQSLVFNTDSYETSISPVVPKFKFLKKGSRNPFINVPKNEKNGFRYNSVLDSDHLNKNKVQNKVTQHKEFSFLSKSPRIDKEKMLTASGTTTSSNGETTTSSYAKTLCFPCTTEQNQTLKENRRKSYASPRWSEHVFTGQERNDNVSSKTKKTDTKCYDISEIPKTDAEGYDTSETKKTDIAPVTKKVGSNKCIIEKCLRGNRDILSGSELPLKHHKCPTYDRSCLSLPRLSEVMLGSNSNGYGMMKRREMLIKTGQSSGVRATRSVSPRIQPNNRRIMTPGGNTETSELYVVIAQLQRESLIKDLRYQKFINRLGHLLYSETLKNKRLAEKYNNLHEVGVQTDLMDNSISLITDTQEQECTRNFFRVSEEDQDAALCKGDGHVRRWCQSLCVSLVENNVFNLIKAWKPFKMELERLEALEHSNPFIFSQSKEYIKTQTKNGFIVKCPSRGWNFFFCDNGDIRGENEAGFSYYQFVKDNVYTIEDSSGIVYNCFHDGQLDCVYPDGSVDVKVWENGVED